MNCALRDLKNTVAMYKASQSQQKNVTQFNRMAKIIIDYDRAIETLEQHLKQ